MIKLVRGSGALGAIIAFNRLSRRLLAFSHHLQFVLQWGIRPVPGWFDHHLDIFYMWRVTRTPLTSERGILGLLAIKQGASVLELCCGDGFNSFYFYSIRAGKIVAMDIDRDAVAHAKRNFSAANISFVAGDIRRDIPLGSFDNVVWDAALEYFTGEEISALMVSIKDRLSLNGILSGQAILQEVQADEHSFIFRSTDDLVQFLRPHFRNIRLIETYYPSRRSVYFYASDAELSFLTAS